MATYYIDMVNGSDAAAGTSWGAAWKTPNNGSTAARIAPGDTIKVAKSPDKISLGNGTWTSVTSSTQANTTSAITGATNATPIELTVSNHGWATGDVVSINGVGGNTAANGTFIITNTGTNTFTLDGSVGNGTYTSGGTAQNINFRSVKLASNTQTSLINDCITTWNQFNSATVSAATGVGCKTTPQAQQVVTPAGAVNNTKYAAQQIPTTDYSAFTHITLWVTASTVTTANTWKVCLCSDTAGTTIVDTFLLPAIGTTGQPTALVIAKSGGGSLSASIQSVALYSGNTAISSATVILDNINACTATGLNLQSSISPVSSNTDLYNNYSIAGIINNIVLLDQSYQTTNLNTTGIRGYYNDTNTGTITTYYRQSLDYAGLNSLGYTTISGAMGDCSEAGTLGNITTWSGGWNTGTDTQESVTLVYIPGGSVGWTPKDYNKVEWMGIYRGARAFGQNSSQARAYSGWTIANCFAVGSGVGYFSTGTSVLTGVLYPNTITNFGITVCGSGIQSQYQQLNVDTVKSYSTFIALPTAATTGVISNTCGNSIFKNTEVYNSGQVAVFNTNASTMFYNTTAKYNAGLTYSTNTCYFNTVTTSGNSYIFYVPTSGNQDGGNQYIQDITYSESSIYSNTGYGFGNSYMSGLNGTANNFLGYTYQGVISRETSITHSGASSWKVNLLTNARDSGNPITLNIAQVYLTANVPTTISAWLYLTSANLGANIEIPAYQIAGVTTDQIATANSATVNSWQQVSMTFTPTASGVVTLQANFWLTTGTNQSVYIDDLTLPTGISTVAMEQPYFGTPWVQNQGSSAVSVAYGAVGL